MLYTFIMEYAGGTYIDQIVASQLAQAIKKWINQLDVRRTDKAGPPFVEYFKQMIEIEAPVAVDETKNVWCFSALPMGKYCLINIILTVEHEGKGLGITTKAK